MDEPTFAELQRAVRLLEEPDPEGARARVLSARLRIAVGTQGRRQTARYLDAALADLRAEVGERSELALVAAELKRLEASYGS